MKRRFKLFTDKILKEKASEVKQIFDKFGIKQVKFYFYPMEQAGGGCVFYIEPDDKSSALEKKVRSWAHNNNIIMGTFAVVGFTAFDSLLVPKEAKDFKHLLQERQKEREDSEKLNGSSVKTSVPSVILEDITNGLEDHITDGKGKEYVSKFKLRTRTPTIKL